MSNIQLTQGPSWMESFFLRVRKTFPRNLPAIGQIVSRDHDKPNLSLGRDRLRPVRAQALELGLGVTLRNH